MTSKQPQAEGTFSSPSPLLENNLNEPNNALWTVEDVAGYLKLQPETIRSLARRGELPAIKFGKVGRFQMAAIHELLLKKGETVPAKWVQIGTEIGRAH